ncbi:hypothetical protein [Fusobacterium nucleatum]|uniref:hypothetical protein n=1 Tax=Fusobacterium nucleatum TaxID=851 RepID=UPI000425A2B9|nr:hypothetical protein [Fusobacterium nucleatum]ALF23991.1 hypothetical protein RO05_06285 [Fusobacterium nucleatum subsp. nucleatum ChDC F316]ASG26681.1 hypothetical protein RN84_07575 [Fusobacterium nucleatum subsp. nucleatum]
MLYLKRLSDNIKVRATIKEIKYSKSGFKNWLFDWSKTEKKAYKILALYVEGDNRIQGAISIRENLQNRTIEIDIVESVPFNSSYNKKIKDKEYIGVAICLFVEVCKRSFENGYDGYVEFTAKSNLVKYYMDNMRAIPIDAQRMYINTSGAKWLIEKYYGGVDL